MSGHTARAGFEAAGRGAAAIETDAVSVVIDGRRIVDSVGFAAHRGEVHALIGPNGAGKSTLLAALAGDQAVSEGRVLVGGRPLADWTLKALARERAVLLQQGTVFFPFTVRQVVSMGRRPWLRTDREDDDDTVVAEALRLTDLALFGERRLPSLSGGERGRAAFARTLAQEAGILLLDEPTAALDLGHQEGLLQIARDRASAGDAVVVVLHDLTLAAAWADRITLLDDGRVSATGTPDEVLTSERVSAVYRHPVEVLRHPATGAAIVLPMRAVR